MYVMTNRALNNVDKRGRVRRLVSLPNYEMGELEEKVKSAFNTAIHLEKSYLDFYSKNNQIPHPHLFSLAHSILSVKLELHEWNNLFYILKPQFDHSLSLLEGIQHLENFKAHYEQAMLRLFEKYQMLLEFNASQDILPYKKVIHSLFSPPPPQQYPSPPPQQYPSPPPQQYPSPSPQRPSSPPQQYHQDNQKKVDEEQISRDKSSGEKQREEEREVEYDLFEMKRPRRRSVCQEEEILQNQVLNLLLSAEMDTILVGMRSDIYAVNVMRNLKKESLPPSKLISAVQQISQIQEEK